MTTPEEIFHRSNNEEEKLKVIFDFAINPGYSTYFHTTTSDRAKSILKNGFRFQLSGKSTDYVFDQNSIAYWINARKQYGDAVVIIQIEDTVRRIEEISKIEKAKNKEYWAENSEFLGNDFNYILKPRYIKGFYDKETHKLTLNKLFKK